MADTKPKARRVPPTEAEKAALEKAQHRRFLDEAHQIGVPEELSESFDEVAAKVATAKPKK